MTLLQDTPAVQQRKAEGERGSGRHAIACLALLLVLLWTQHGHAAPEPPRLLDLNLPAHHLEESVQAFSRATGMAVRVDRELTHGRRAIGVKGRYTAQQALDVLLTGSGLMARYASSDAFTLQVPRSDPQPEVRGAKARAAAQRLNTSYAAALQQAIERSLCRSPLTRPGSFRALVQVWISAHGQIEFSRLVSTTGNAQRDEALVRSLSATRIDRPAPSSLRLPVTLLLMPETTGTRMKCTTGEGAFRS